MSVKIKIILLCLFVGSAALIAAGIVFDDRSGYFCSIGILAALSAILILKARKLRTGEIVLTSSMAALATMSRAAFYWLPQFKPVTAVVIISGLMLGPAVGGTVGALAGFLSNFFFGQGVWTPYQMTAWAVIGYLSGVFLKKSVPKFALMIWGFTATFFIYGFIMNTASVLMLSSAVRVFDISETWVFYVSGIVPDLTHAVSTAFFLFFIYNPLKNKIDRVVVKYGLFRNRD